MNGSHEIPQPIPYQGSKRRIAPAILQHFPDHISRLVEPFAGSAAISIAVAARGSAERFWINDAHSALIQLWKEIINRPEWLGSRYTYLWMPNLARNGRISTWSAIALMPSMNLPISYICLPAVLRRPFGTTQRANSTTHQTIAAREPGHQRCTADSVARRVFCVGEHGSLPGITKRFSTTAPKMTLFTWTHRIRAYAANATSGIYHHSITLAFARISLSSIVETLCLSCRTTVERVKELTANHFQSPYN